jgi:hypothetical protein
MCAYVHIYIYIYVYICYIYTYTQDIEHGEAKPMEVVIDDSALTKLIIEKPTKVLQRHWVTKQHIITQPGASTHHILESMNL